MAGGCGGARVRQTGPHPGARAWVARGDAAYERMAFQEAWEAYRKAEALGLRDGIVSYRIDVLRQVLRKPSKGPPHRAQTPRLLRQAYRRQNPRPAAFFYLAHVLEAATGDGSHKARLYGEAVRRFEAGGFGRLAAADYEKLGRMYLHLGLPNPAERLLRKAQDLDPNNAFAAYGLGNLYRSAGRYRSAAEQFERLLRIAPHDQEGQALLGESAFAAGDYDRAVEAYEAALEINSTDGRSRAGLRRAREALARRSRLKKEAGDLVWEVGFRTRLRPLTLPDDGLRLEAETLGPAVFGPGRQIVFASGRGRRFHVHTLSADGLRLVRRVASASGFTGYGGGPGLLMVAAGLGRRRELGIYDAQRGTFKRLRSGDCRQPSLSWTNGVLLCAGREGVRLVELPAGNATTLSREPGARQPRLSRDGRWVVLAEGDEVVWFDREGKERGRLRPGAGRAAASFPDVSPDGRWIVSGERGLHLTSVGEKVSVALAHPGLRGAGRATFGPEGRILLFVREGRLERLHLPEAMESFFALRRAEELVGEGKFAAAVRHLRERPAGEAKRAAYHLLLGRALMGLRLLGDAEAEARRAQELAPGDWRPHLLLGRVRAAREDWEGAARRLDRAVALSPQRFEGYLERAKVRAAQGRFDGAIRDYQTSLRLLKGGAGSEGEAAVLGLLGLYVRTERLDSALRLLLDEERRLGARSIERIRTAAQFQVLRADPRFREVLGLPPEPVGGRSNGGRPRSEGGAAKAAAGPFPYRAKVFIDDNPTPIESEVIADDGEVVTIRAFGVDQKYRRERLRIVR